jgi:hypothetical protein
MLNAYAIHCGSMQDGALLVLAHNREEAKRIGFRPYMDLWEVDSFTHLRVNRLHNADMPFLTGRYGTEPLAVLDPETCRHCGCWHPAPLNERGACKDCGTGELP